MQIKNGKCEKKDKFHWTVRGPTHGLGAADKGMMVTKQPARKLAS